MGRLLDRIPENKRLPKASKTRKEAGNPAANVLQ